MMGDKIEAKKIMKKFGVPTVPGSEGEVKSESDALTASDEIGYPVLLKASAGGGGRGMKIVNSKKELKDALPIIKQEALSFLEMTQYTLKNLLTHLDILKFK